MSAFDTIAEYLQPEVARALAWRRRAACLGQWEQVDFFPDRGVKASAAKQLCVTCPVRTDCLTDALERYEREGCWGGTTEKDRRPLMRRVATGEPVASVVTSYQPVAPVQCTATGATTGQRCRRFAPEGETICPSHRGESLRAMARSINDEGAELTEEQTRVLIDAAVTAATAAMAEMLAEAVERVDTLAGVVAAGFGVLGALDDTLAQAATAARAAASGPESHDAGPLEPGPTETAPLAGFPTHEEMP